MSELGIGLLYGGATLVAMFSGMPIAFALGAVAVAFMLGFMPVSSLDTITQNVYEEMASITLLSIPLFILKGAAIGKSRAGQDLYLALHAWMRRIPGGLGIANVFGDAKVRAFFHALFAGALAQRPPPFVLHGLDVAGKLRAVTGSSRAGKRLICEFGSIADDELAFASPGDFLFFANIEEACAQGLEIYDFSVGDEPYKRQWCDLETRHLDVLVPLTAKGRALAFLLRQDARLKSFVKKSPVIWQLTKKLRRRAAGREPIPGEE